MLIKNGRVIDSKSGLDQVCDVLVLEGKIKDIGNNLAYDGQDIIDARGKIVAPGFVDIHVHLREPGQTHKEDIASGARAAAAGGYTTIVAMANTNPTIDNVEVLKAVIETMNKEKIKVYSAAAITKGFGGKELTDMEALKETGAVLFTDDGIPLKSEEIVLQAMEMSKKINIPLSFHEEDNAYIKNPGYNKSEVIESLGIGGAPNFSEYKMVARDLMAAKYTGASIGIQHISSKEAVELVRSAKKMGVRVIAEVTPHHFSLNENIVLEKKTLAKMNPPLRTEEDRLAIIKGMQDNTIEIIATDHAPHTAEEKNKADITKAPSGIIGLETALSLAITNLVRPGYLTINEVLEKLTYNPAKFLGLRAGVLEVGTDADLVIFDENKLVSYNKFYSKSSNTPFINTPLYGSVECTIARGEIVFLKGEENE